MSQTTQPITTPEEPFAKAISKKDINALPLCRYRGEIRLVDNDLAMEKAISDLKKEPVLGFDTESRPAFSKGESYPISIVQLASEKVVYLFQMGKLSDPDGLRRILSSGKNLKVGVAIHDDIRKLQELWKFKEHGFVEISEITRKIDITNTGLRSLSAILLGFRISKNAQVSNWARQDLTKAQMVYAATDAWVSRRLYMRLDELGYCEVKKRQSL